ncbi:hypothetical protein [Bacillus taeanensis]|uniref:Uncharacterized protein n=1 Tax=Bacillus taeanensis TaxID=273032 RepID=A0A366XYB9_9BACI|nr:hypothetical protein [Bacillus taeanensis]RBW69759.1 hypothetical protein DS031_09510 [Bacillus taeanensis]
MTQLSAYFFAVLAGFALLRAPIGGTFLASLGPVLDIVAIFSIVFFSIILIIKAFVVLIGKNL